MFRAEDFLPDACAAYTNSYGKGKVLGASRCRYGGLNCCNIGHFSRTLSRNKYMQRHEITACEAGGNLSCAGVAADQLAAMAVHSRSKNG
jgi:hypothetical protein